MSGLFRIRQNKTAAGIAGLLMLVLLLFSSFYIATESHHHCTGEDCPVCICLEQCIRTIREIGYGAAVLLVRFLPVFCFLISVLLSAPFVAQSTPVARKVRLNR